MALALVRRRPRPLSPLVVWFFSSSRWGARSRAWRFSPARLQKGVFRRLTIEHWAGVFLSLGVGPCVYGPYLSDNENVPVLGRGPLWMSALVGVLILPPCTG
ncbi:MAG: hypothetical protein CM15mP125_3930 [Gammaproteobacteria bacterium]|nr:MAG: hypothetical protein CM15mP125_3930 [Gammaproteobacteria bacterium]